MPEIKLVETDRAEWLQHPLTADLLRHLKLSEVETQGAWASEQFTGDSLEQGALQNAKALGGVAMLKRVVEYVEKGE